MADTPKERGTAVTLRDVAARAGVSPVVVSRVLHNKALAIRVSEATAVRVRQAALDLGYRRNVAAINFRNRQAHTIGILHGFGKVMPPLEGATGYLAALLDGVIAGAFRHGYSVTLCPKLLGQTPEDGISDGRFDGLVLYNADVTNTDGAMLKRCGLPLVIVHSRTGDFGGTFPAIICDNHGGIGLAVDHLVARGHRRIAYVAERWPHSREITERRTAFVAHCDAHGIGPETRGLFEYDELERIFDAGYTAVVAHHDGLAGEIYEAAERRGVRIPEELSVVGFDSTSYCRELRPTLTSVRQPLTEMGQAAAELLVSAMRGELADAPEVTFPCGLDVRESVRRIDA